LCTYTDEVFKKPEFLQCTASEQQLIDRTVVNFHLGILGRLHF